jgi:crotonobetainyl-CoA:carnitine CoA-transferase CaiB-like acyl-CoA transferase
MGLAILKHSGSEKTDPAPAMLADHSPLASSPSTLGEHTEYVCKEILKLSDEEIAQLVIDEVLR